MQISTVCVTKSQLHVTHAVIDIAHKDISESTRITQVHRINYIQYLLYEKVLRL